MITKIRSRLQKLFQFLSVFGQKRANKIFLSLLIILLLAVTIQACHTYYFRTNYQDANSLLHGTESISIKPFLKAHLKNGDVCILLDTWQVDTILNRVSGSGIRYDFNREITHQGTLTIPIDSVAIFETNKKLINPEESRVTALGILAAVDVAIGVYCITNPKACFGSCPTFYMNENDNFHYADAEGFTNAISPSMEYSDIDALNNPTITGDIFSLTMKNEALETHCVREAKLYAYPRKKGERVFQTPENDFYRCSSLYQIQKATASEGDITALLHDPDMNERFSLADSTNLHSKEEMYLHFENVNTSKNIGLILNFRQTLLTTYLFYSAMGYMGDNVGDMYSLLETNKPIRDKFDATTKLLGALEVYSWSEKNAQWELQGIISETGPIAINKQLLRFKNSVQGSSVTLKIVANKGLWRLDYAALTTIEEKVNPIVIQPSGVLNKGKIDPHALQALTAQDKLLISMPGSEYKMNFILPNRHQDYELFVYSKGYYLEWMRNHWIQDKNLAKLRQMVDNPKDYLKEQAKEFKMYESTMEKQFWDSKINTKAYSYYEK